EARDRYFEGTGREVVLREAVRVAVTFQHRNLAADDAELWAPESYDIVFCRNVIMYLARDHQLALVDRITRALTPGGYLFLGHAETLRDLSQQFTLCHSPRAFYYRRGAARDPALASPITPALDVAAAVPELSARPVIRARADGWVDAIRGS